MSRIIVLLVLFSTVARAEDTAELLGRMTPWIRACIARQDVKEYAAFHGCWDWHSAVHGHWALLRIGRVTGDDRGAHEAERSLSLANVRREEDLLRTSPSFENPYGRAWFLRLAMEFERWADARRVREAARLRGVAGLVADSLLAHFRAVAPSPESSEYDNASWAFYQLHAYLTFTGDSARLRGVESTIRSAFVESQAKLSFGYSTKEFFSVYGNWAYLVAKTSPSAVLGDFLSAHPIRYDELQPKEVTTDHSKGQNWSRIWALKALALRVSDPIERRRLETVRLAHVARAAADHERFKDDYAGYGHWVPQFAVYALTEGLVDDDGR